MLNAIAQFALDLFQAAIIAALMFGPLFYYFMFMMKE
jgi:hypothetical protein